jgi:hypothetical protein
MVEHLPNRCEALNSIPNAYKKQKKEDNEEEH